MAIAKYLSLLGVVSCLPCAASAAGGPRLGPLYDDFSLTLESGRRTEILGPLYYSEERETRHTWAIPPLTLAHTWDPATDSEEWDFAYPLLTYDRFGKEVHWQIMQLWNVAGGKNQDASEDHRPILLSTALHDSEPQLYGHGSVLWPLGPPFVPRRD